MELSIEASAQELLAEANRQAKQREIELEERTASRRRGTGTMRLTGPYMSSAWYVSCAY